MRRRQRDGKKILKKILLWVTFAGYLTIIEPSSIFSFAGFYILLSLALFFTLRSFFRVGRTFIWITIIIVYLLLRQLHLDNILNTIILAGIFVTFEIYFRKA